MTKSDHLISIGERIEELIKVAGGVAPLARAAGVSRASIDKWRKGDADPSSSNILALAAATKVSPAWLITGDVAETVADDLTAIPRHDVQASAGNGCFVDQAPVLNTIPFRPEFFSQNLQRNPADMIIIDATGDSMQPVMHDRDLLMIDKSTATETPTGAIYAFTYDDAVFVKRLQRQPGGIQALSANPDYPPFTITKADMDKFHLIGRVVWIGRML